MLEGPYRLVVTQFCGALLHPERPANDRLDSTGRGIRYLYARIFAFFTFGVVGLSQISNSDGRTPNTSAAVVGSKTVLGYRLSPDARLILVTDSPSRQILIRLPSVRRKAVPQLLGMLQHGADIELFVGWVDLESEPGHFEHHIEVFRGRRGTEAALAHDFTLFGGPGFNVSFFEPPDARDTAAVLFDIQGGAYWGTTYLLAPDRQSVDRLFDASDYEFADLDHDGVYELIAWNRRPFDVRCTFGIFGVRFYPEIFVRAGASYRKAWPPSDWPAPDGELEDRFRKHERNGVPLGANFQVMAGFADLDADGVAELIVLQDQLRDEPTQALAIYRLERKVFHPVVQASLPPERIAYLLEGVRDSPDGKEILVRTVTPAKCHAGGIPPAETAETETAYTFHGGRLQPPQPHKR